MDAPLHLPFFRNRKALKNDLAKMEQAARIKDDQIQQLEDSMRSLQQNLDAVSQVLRLNPSEADVEAALRRKNKVPDQL